MRLIDADALDKVFEQAECDVINREWGDSNGFSGAAVFNMLDDAPTIDAVPVKHGRWYSYGEGRSYDVIRCSCCKEELPYISSRTTVDNPYSNIEYIEPTNYCPNCGADMREVSE